MFLHNISLPHVHVTSVIFKIHVHYFTVHPLFEISYVSIWGIMGISRYVQRVFYSLYCMLCRGGGSGMVGGMTGYDVDMTDYDEV